MKPRIGVIGSGEKISPEIQAMAERIGMDIAKNNCILVCGGKGGVMEAACRGAKSKGGITVGILPSLEAGEANEHVDVAVNTGIGLARNALIAATSDVIIAIDGGVGTLSEIALAFNYGKKVVFVSNSGGIEEMFRDKGFEGEVRGMRVHYSDAGNAVEMALSLI